VQSPFPEGGSALVPHRWSPDEGGLPAGEQPVRRTMTRVGPYRVHALDRGEGPEAVLLLHGLAGSATWWSRTVGVLADRYRVLVPDLIGFGRTRSVGRFPSLKRLAEVLDRWLAELGVERVHLVGHSMGGQISVHLTAARPDRVERLVLVDAAGIPRPLHPLAIARSAVSLAPPGAWGRLEFLPRIAGDAWTAGPRTLGRAIRHILSDDVRPLLPTIRQPTLILWGERDRLVPLDHARELRRRIPNARLLVIEGAAHNPMIDRPAAFNRALTRFLEGESVGV
jgi:pimeloyl-ACP methyl ester carboxylesterase